MIEEPLIKSQRKDIGALRAFVFCDIVFFGMALSFLYSAFKDKYPDFTLIVVGCVCLLFVLLFSCVLLIAKNVEIYTDRVIFKSLLGYTSKVIFIADITGWSERRIDSGKAKGNYLTVYTAAGQFVITSQMYKEYDEIKPLLMRGEERSTAGKDALVAKRARNISLVLLAAGAGFLLGGYTNKDDREKPVAADEITTLHDIVINRPAVSRSKGSFWTVLKLKHYPAFAFNLSNRTAPTYNIYDFVSNVSTGETIDVDILADIYGKKLAGTIPLGFWDKYSAYSRIEILGVRLRGTSFATLDGYNAGHSGRQKSYVVTLMIVGGMLTFWGGLILISVLSIKRPKG